LFAPLSLLAKRILIPTSSFAFIRVGLLIRLGLTTSFLIGRRLGLQCSQINNLFWITHDATSRYLIKGGRWSPNGRTQPAMYRCQRRTHSIACGISLGGFQQERLGIRAAHHTRLH
jgi:hypothetical protein